MGRKRKGLDHERLKRTWLHHVLERSTWHSEVLRDAFERRQKKQPRTIGEDAGKLREAEGNAVRAILRDAFVESVKKEIKDWKQREFSVLWRRRERQIRDLARTKLAKREGADHWRLMRTLWPSQKTVRRAVNPLLHKKKRKRAVLDR